MAYFPDHFRPIQVTCNVVCRSSQTGGTYGRTRCIDRTLVALGILPVSVSVAFVFLVTSRARCGIVSVIQQFFRRLNGPGQLRSGKPAANPELRVFFAGLMFPSPPEPTLAIYSVSVGVGNKDRN